MGGELMRRWTSRRAGAADHLHDLAARRAAHDRVVDHDHPLAAEHAAQRVQLQLHAEVADRLLRLDEGAADVVGADEPHRERDPALLGVADRGGDAGVGHRDDDVRLRPGARRRAAARARGAPRTPTCRTAPSPAARSRRARRRSARAAAAGAAGEEPLAAQPRAVDDDHLARLDLAHVLRLDEVERGGLATRAPSCPCSCPSTSGRKPIGSRTPTSAFGVRNRIE